MVAVNRWAGRLVDGNTVHSACGQLAASSLGLFPVSEGVRGRLQGIAFALEAQIIGFKRSQRRDAPACFLLLARQCGQAARQGVEIRRLRASIRIQRLPGRIEAATNG